MELPEYRTVLADLNDHFGKGQWITIKQIAEYDGSDVRTVRKRYQIPKKMHGLNKAVLARRICELSR